MEAAQQTAVFPPCGEVSNGQLCGQESTAELETVSGEKIFRCTAHSGIVKTVPAVHHPKRSFSQELSGVASGWVRFLWQAGLVLGGLYLIVAFVKWAWIHS
jgi:hypothetical protein